MTPFTPTDFIRQIRSKCAWLTFFWSVAALTNFGEVGQYILDRSWWWAALHAVFVALAAGLAIDQAREWCKWDRLLGGTQ